MTEPFTPSRVDLVERVRRSHENLDRLCDGLSEEQMTRPGPEGWSVKDHLAHLAAWEQGIAALLQSRPRHAAMGIDRALWETHDTDAINAVLHERDRDRTVAEVRSAVDAAGQDLVAALGRLDDGDLVKPYAHYQPDERPTNPRPVVDWIAGNSFGHIEEHLPWIRAVLTQTA